MWIFKHKSIRTEIFFFIRLHLYLAEWCIICCTQCQMHIENKGSYFCCCIAKKKQKTKNRKKEEKSEEEQVKNG